MEVPDASYVALLGKSLRKLKTKPFRKYRLAAISVQEIKKAFGLLLIRVKAVK